MPRSVFTVMTVLSLALALLPAAPAHAGKPAPRGHVLALDMVWGEPPGPESWLDDLERALAHELGQRGCFTSIQRFDADRTPADALVLRMLINEYRERSTYGVSIAALQSPAAAPDTKQSLVVEVKAMFELELLSRPGGVRLKRKHFGERVSHRPQTDEDPRYEARRRMLEAVRRTVARMVCKGSRNKFEKELAKALAAAEAPLDPSE